MDGGGTDLTFFIPEGELYALLGRQRRGKKTTTIRMLCGLIVPHVGRTR